MNAFVKRIKEAAHHTNFRVVFAVVFTLVILGGAYAGYRIMFRVCCALPPIELLDGSMENELRFSRAIDGIAVATADDQYPPLAAVMIDNHPNARPAYGLAKAPLVYEVPVEGLFTRYVAFWPIYPSNALAAPTSTYDGKIGPVRSARPYMLDIVAEYDALYAHVGGSPEALEQLQTQERIYDVNEFSKGWYFWRDTARYAPHNVLTTLENLADAHDRFFVDHSESAFIGAGFTAELPQKYAEDSTEAKMVVINWLETGNVVEWEYDAEAGVYRRFRGGKKHVDQDGSQVEAGTVIVQRVQYDVIDDYGRLDVEMVGSGDAVLYRDGIAIPVTWSKPTRTARTQWRYVDGTIVPLKAGAPVWVHVVPDKIEVQEFGVDDLLQM